MSEYHASGVNGGWWCLGEERQVHFGENFVDPSGFALSAFGALAWLRNASAGELARADLYHLVKLSLARDAGL